MTERDYQREAWQLHLAFHQQVLDDLNKHLHQQPITQGEIESIKKIVEHGHSMFDTFVLWIAEMQKEIYRLQGQLREAEKLAVLLKTGVRKREEGKSCIGGLT